jgi:cytochrome o ubiquinol oxidase subunit IV
MKNKIIISEHPVVHGSLRSYIAGFGLSLLLTITAYTLVVSEAFSRRMLLAAIFMLALVQFIVQVFFFLHLGNETKPRWKQIAFLFMIMVVLILVLGSIWIMASLDYRHDMTPAQTDQSILKDEQVHNH